MTSKLLHSTRCVMVKANMIPSNNIDHRLVHRRCVQNCTTMVNTDRNVVRNFQDKHVCAWETAVYLALVETGLFPLATASGSTMTYSTHNMVSLQCYLQHDVEGCCNVTNALNEVFSFVASLRRYKLLHGNLHVENILLKPHRFQHKPKFYVLDLSNSYVFKKTNAEPPKWRTSFLGEYKEKEREATHMRYWDLFTLYVALKKLLKTKPQVVDCVNKLARQYIPDDVLKEMIGTYYTNAGVMTSAFFDEFK